MAKKKATKPGCNCIEQVNKQLEDSNAKVAQYLQVNFKTGEATMSNPMVAVEKKIHSSRTRTKLPSLICSFCPFCGKKYPD